MVGGGLFAGVQVVEFAVKYFGLPVGPLPDSRLVFFRKCAPLFCQFGNVSPKRLVSGKVCPYFLYPWKVAAIHPGGYPREAPNARKRKA